MNDLTVKQPWADERRFQYLISGISDYAIYMLDPNGYVSSWNAGANRFKGYVAQEILGEHFSRFYTPEDREAGKPARALAIALKEGKYEAEGWRVRKDGSRFWAHVVIDPIYNEEGVLLGFAKVTRDVTERKRAEDALRDSERRFRLLVNGVTDYALFMLSPEGTVTNWNPGAERIHGYAQDEITGSHFSRFYTPEDQDVGLPQRALETAGATGRFEAEGLRVRKDGSRFWAHVVIDAIHDDDGTLLGFAKLTRDLTGQKRTEALEIAGREHEQVLEAERSARIEAQRVTRIKDEFLATLSHELRTPLSSILGWTQVLKLRADVLKPAEIKRAVEVIDRNARAQVRLIEDLLDLNRIMAGKVRLVVKQVSLLEIVQSVIESVEPGAKAKDIRLESRLEADAPPVAGDSDRLQQVVWNLLSNAIKFTGKGGRVDVVLRRAGASTVLSVADTGIGIPESFLPRVFDRFSQNDASTTRSFGGLGLGLAISKQLVELHGGTIRASSPGEGRGATFFVELPLAAVPARSDDLPAEPAIADAARPRSALLPTLDGVHVFVVDDEADGRELLRRVLEDQAATVTALSSGEEALKALRHAKPHLIVSDIGMPVMDGYQLMRTLRAREAKGERIPAVALTAFARADDRKRALLAGYQAHLAKPFDVAELVLVAADLTKR